MRETTIQGTDIKAYYSNTEAKDFVSVEYEVGWQPGTIKVREIYQMFLAQKLIDEGVHPTNHLLLHKINAYVKDKFPQIQNIGYDGGGLEFNIAPATLDAHKEQYKFYKELQECLVQFGFSDELTSAGIHLNIDYHMLGENRALTVRKLAQFMFNNEDFIVKVSCRKRGAQVMSDIHDQLGDLYNLSDKTEKFNEFVFHKNLIEQHFKQPDQAAALYSIFNFSLSKQGRRAMELRWFGTTLNIEEFYSIIEFGYAFIYFLREHDFHQLDLEYFGKYVARNAALYRNLHEKLLTLPEIASYAVLTAQS